MDRLSLSSLVLLAALTAGVAACDRGSGPSDSPESSSTRTAASSGSEPERESASDEETSASADSDADDTGLDRIWIGRFDEHKHRILVDLDELDGGAGGLAGQATFNSSGDAPYLPKLLPEPYRELEEIDVLTAEGTTRLALDKITRDAVGPSDFVLRLMTEPSEKLADRIDEWTLVAPAGEFADGATLEPVEATPAHAKAVPKIREAVMGTLTDDQRESFDDGFSDDGADRSITTDHVADVGGAFPSPRARFVTVNGPTVTGGVQGQEFPIVRAVLFTTDTGDVTDTLSVMFGPNHAHGHAATARADVLGTADPDGDGTDGVLYRADDAVRWVDFENGDPVHP